MKLYNFQEIFEIGDCLEYAKNVLGLKEGKTPGRFKSPIRPESDSDSFAMNKDGYFDHVSKEKGGLVKLVSLVNHDGDMIAAQNELGEYYSLNPSKSYKGEEKSSRKVVKEYIYEDDEGNPAHKTLRYDPKDFRQMHLSNGEWVWGLGKCKTYPYRLNEWRMGRYVFIVEGEKDTDSLFDIGVNATCNAMGSKSWKESYNKYFKGKKVILIADNDPAGKEHVDLVAKELCPVAESLRIMTLPGGDKSDVTDWIEAGGNQEQLFQLVTKVPLVNFEKEEEVDEISEAKKMNETPFSNYCWSNVSGSQGKIQTGKVPKLIHKMFEELGKRFWGFPRKIGSTLFDHDRETNEIAYIYNAPSLFSWIAGKSKNPVDWVPGAGFVTKNEFYEYVLMNAQFYQGTSAMPYHPERKNVYCSSDSLPAPSPDKHYFNELCKFFKGSSEVDDLLIKVLFASPLYYRHDMDKPAWIIDSVAGQGTGKTTLAELVAKLYGSNNDYDSQSPVTVSQRDLKRDSQAVFRRLLTASSRRKRVFLIDNADGEFKSDDLSSLITAKYITGMAPYGRSEETRPNDLNFIITVNGGTFDNDMITRSYLIHLDKPRYSKTWKKDIVNYIEKNRFNIIADIRALLEEGANFQFQPLTRFPEFEKDVVAPIIGDVGKYSDVFKTDSDRKTNCNSDTSDAEAIDVTIREHLMEAGFDPENDSIYLHNDALHMIFNPDVTQHTFINRLKNKVRMGMLPFLSLETESFPRMKKDFNISRKRGITWRNPELNKKISAVIGIEKGNIKNISHTTF